MDFDDLVHSSLESLALWPQGLMPVGLRSFEHKPPLVCRVPRVNE